MRLRFLATKTNVAFTKHYSNGKYLFKELVANKKIENVRTINLNILKKTIILLLVGLVIALAVGFLIKTPKAIAPVLPETPQPEIKELATPVQVVKPKATPIRYKDPVPLAEKKEIAEKIAIIFPDHKEVMVAIALSESGLNKNATGYNCYYKVVDKDTGTYDKISGKYLDFSNSVKIRTEGYRSTSCRVGDQAKAWSKDGGVFQINSPTKEDYDVDKNLARAKHKYDTQGLKAWTVYTTGSYKKYLPKAKELLAME